MKRIDKIKLVGIAGILIFIILGMSQSVVSKPIKNEDKTNITDLSIGSTIKDKKHVIYAKEPKHEKIEFLTEPPKLTEEKRKMLEDAKKENKIIPKLPYDKEPVGPTQPPINIDLNKTIEINNLNTKNGILADSDFIIYRNSPIGNCCTIKDFVLEPAAGQNGNFIFYTANWFAARSTDGGNTFALVDPWQGMPSFCCDQDTLYDSSRDIFIWYRQGIRDANGVNIFRLGVSNDNGANWFFYDFRPTDVDASWTNQWWDYPQLALTKDYLYITSNMFDNNGKGRFTRSVMLEIPLNGLRDHTGFGYGYYPRSEYTLALASHYPGAVPGVSENTIYFATMLSNSKLRIFGTTGGNPDVYIYDRDIPAWNSGGNYNCPSPDGENWCHRLINRLIGGYITTELGFMWTSPQGSGYPYPYVYIANFGLDDKSYKNNQILWNDVHAFAYPNAYPNSRGDLGIDFFIGGGCCNPNHIVGIDDIYTGYHEYNFATTNWGTNGSEEWGDYIRVRPYIPAGKLWIATGYTQQGGTTGAFTDPRYIVFGREVNRIASLGEAVDLNSEYVEQWTTGGNAYWYGETHSPTSYGNDVAMSDRIRDNEETWMQNTIRGPGSLYFIWSVGSEQNFDKLQFYIDGIWKEEISGMVAPRQAIYKIGPGAHTIKWRYVKDASISVDGDAGFVDNIRYFPEATPQYFWLDPNPVNYGGASKVNVYVRDPFNRPIPNADVFLRVTPNGGDISPNFGKTDSDGYFSTTYWPAYVTSQTSYTISVQITKSDYDTGQKSLTVYVRPKVSIISAIDNVDNNLIKWSIGGDKPWFGEDTPTYQYYYGGDAAQSGPITHNQNSWVRANVTGPGKLKFYWRIDSESNFDFLKFYIDGIYKSNISGYYGWLDKTYNIGPGKHYLVWKYTKDSSVSKGADAGMLDRVVYASVFLKSPNGGETWTKGTTKRIKWNYTFSTWTGPYIKIDLLKGGTFNRAISSNRSIGSKGYGYYDWPIPSNLATAADYKIRITSKSNSFYMDVSDKNFAIN